MAFINNEMVKLCDLIVVILILLKKVMLASGDLSRF